MVVTEDYDHMKKNEWKCEVDETNTSIVIFFSKPLGALFVHLPLLHKI